MSDGAHTIIHDPFLRQTPILNPEQWELVATGFYYESNNTSYLITNRHMLKDETGSMFTRFRILRREQENLGNTQPHYIELFEEGEPRWLEHPDEPADVIAVPLTFDVPNETGNSTYSSDQFLPENVNLMGGNAATLWGYPYDILDHLHYLPIIRSAIIATPYKVDFNGDRCFLIDVVSQGGASGSPVLTSQSHLYQTMDDSRIFGGKSLIGIHSGPVFEGEDLGLNRVWKAELIDEIIRDGEQPDISI